MKKGTILGFNLIKRGLIKGVTLTQSLLENTILGKLILQGAQYLVHIARAGIKLGITVATAVASAAQAAFASFATIPYVGVILGGIAAVAFAALIYQLAKPKKALGGPIIGPTHDQGGVDIEAEGGEYMINAKAAGIIGPKNLETINQGNLPFIGAAVPTQNNDDVIAAIDNGFATLAASPGMKETKTDTINTNEVFFNTSKIHSANWQNQVLGSSLFS